MKIIFLFFFLTLIQTGSALSEERQLEKGDVVVEALEASLRKCCEHYEKYKQTGEMGDPFLMMSVCGNYFNKSIDPNNAGDMGMIKRACTNEIEKDLPENPPGQRDDDSPVIERQ